MIGLCYTRPFSKPIFMAPLKQFQLLISQIPYDHFFSSLSLSLAVSLFAPSMAAQELRRRAKDEPSPSSTTTTTTTRTKAQRQAMARRGLKSLAIAITIPLFVTVVVLSFLGSSKSRPKHTKTFWHPPEWAFHLASASSACFMSLAAWLTWAEGGFHRRPVALLLYLAQLLLSLAWAPCLFRLGSGRAGFAVSVGLVAALAGCMRWFPRLNPIAADLVKPCVAWAAFLVVFSYRVM